MLPQADPSTRVRTIPEPPAPEHYPISPTGGSPKAEGFTAMNLVETDLNTAGAVQEPLRVASLRWRLSLVWHSVARRIPRLVWIGDELDVRVMFPTHGLGKNADKVFDAQVALREAGVTFDSGSGHEGRDWEWDFSLRGPVRVTFRGRASHPERRAERPRPQLAVDNTTAA